jgi:hypothetical protein
VAVSAANPTIRTPEKLVFAAFTTSLRIAGRNHGVAAVGQEDSSPIRWARFRYLPTLSPSMRVRCVPLCSSIFMSDSEPVAGSASTFVSRSKSFDLSVLR